jgi:hypothetical protein
VNVFGLAVAWIDDNLEHSDRRGLDQHPMRGGAATVPSAGQGQSPVIRARLRHVTTRANDGRAHVGEGERRVNACRYIPQTRSESCSFWFGPAPRPSSDMVMLALACSSSHSPAPGPAVCGFAGAMTDADVHQPDPPRRRPACRDHVLWGGESGRLLGVRPRQPARRDARRGMTFVRRSAAGRRRDGGDPHKDPPGIPRPGVAHCA